MSKSYIFSFSLVICARCGQDNNCLRSGICQGCIAAWNPFEMMCSPLFHVMIMSGSHKGAGKGVVYNSEMNMILVIGRSLRPEENA